MYSEEQITKWKETYQEVIGGLISIQIKTTDVGLKLDNKYAKEYLSHGVSRRFSILRTSLENIFSLFPLNTNVPLGRENLTNCEINLHAFAINLAGIFDNWAWAFVHYHDLESEIGSRHRIGLFKKETQIYLPKSIREYLQKPDTIDWQDQYLKGFRDSLVHRIPLYIPPAQLTDEESKRFNEIELEKLPCIANHEWEKLEEIEKEQKIIGKPVFYFIESLNDKDATKPVYLHPQLLSDAMAITEFGKLFMENWHERA